MILRVLKYGDPVLRQEGEIIKKFDKSLLDLVRDMMDTMRSEDGIGIAAQQVGVRKKICICDIKELTKERNLKYDYTLDGKKVPLDLLFPLILVNPAVEPTSTNEEVLVEGCLSFPEIYPPVSRPMDIKVTYQDVEGVSHVITCNGFFARNIQHEVDHLNGVLFIDRTDTRSLNELKSKLKKLKRGTRDFLKKQIKI